MARKFLYLIAACVVLIIAALLALRFWAEDLTEITFVPTADFTPQPPLRANIYADPDMWISRPGAGASDPVRWTPPGPEGEANAPDDSLHAAVFFIHPTSYWEKDRWNAPLEDKVSRERAELLVQGMASPFNRSPDIWIPRYRQAALGAFLTDDPRADQALDTAYRDLLEAFDYFISTVDKSEPIVLAGHSQGAYHLRALIRDRVAGTIGSGGSPLRRRRRRGSWGSGSRARAAISRWNESMLELNPVGLRCRTTSTSEPSTEATRAMSRKATAEFTPPPGGRGPTGRHPGRRPRGRRRRARPRRRTRGPSRPRRPTPRASTRAAWP